MFLGQAKMRMEDQVDLVETKCAYTLIDIRELDAGQLMASGRAGDGPEHVIEIAKRMGGFQDAERQRVLFQLTPNALAARPAAG